MTTDYLLHSELDKVLACLMPGNRLVCEVLLQTGLRVSDCLSIRREQVKRQFWITEAKTGKRRRVNLTDDLVERILSQSRNSEWAFPGRNNENPRKRQTIWKDLKRACVAYRLPCNGAPHSLRKTYAVDLMAKYGDIERVRRALNHDSLTVTLLYAMADKRLQQRKKNMSTGS